MLPVDIALIVLIAAGALFSIVELGITAYIVSWWQHYVKIYINFGFYTYYYHPATPAVYSYLIFCSAIGILVAVGLIVVSFKGRRLGGKTLGWGALVVTTITTIFWLAGFADLASVYQPFVNADVKLGVFGAQLAFAILAWLVFLAIMILNYLTAFGVVRSERPGFQHLAGRRTTTFTTPTPMTTTYHKGSEGTSPAPSHVPVGDQYYDPAAAPNYGPPSGAHVNTPYYEAPGPRNV